MQVMATTLTRRGLLLGAVALAAAAAPTGARAGTNPYPTKMIRLLVGAAAGSTPDVLARVFADQLATTVGQSVVVDNRPGPGGIAAMQALIASEPDGYTLALAAMNQVVFNSYLFPDLPYDPVKGLEPISLLGSTSYSIAVQKSFAADSFAALIAAAKAWPRQLDVGTSPPGTPPHVFAHVLAHMSGMDVSYVPYRSGLDGLTALIRGDVQVLVDSPVIMIPQVKTGAIKVLAVTGRERERELPDVPTIAEAGFPAAECEPWIGLVAPSRTSFDVVALINSLVASILASPAVRQRFETLSFTPRSTTPGDFRKLIAEERVRWGAMIRDAGVRID
jgi:tripartite-type tricarboxylate transporter receptor subunit TctC